MSTKKTVKMPLRRNPAVSQSPRPPRKRVKPLRARAATANAEDYEYDEEEPNMKFSHALIVVLILHLVAVGGVLGFSWMKNRQSNITKTAAVTGAVGGGPEVTARGAVPESSPEKPKTPIWTGRLHTVQAGDTLRKISQKYGVSLASIEKANHINHTSMIRVGQELKIPAAEPGSIPQKAATTASRKEAPSAKKPIIAAVPVNRMKSPPTTKKATAASNSSSASGTIYTVVKGDNPYSIARKFHVSYSKLIKINHISDPTKIQIGQKLKIP